MWKKRKEKSLEKNINMIQIVNKGSNKAKKEKKNKHTHNTNVVLVTPRKK